MKFHIRWNRDSRQIVRRIFSDDVMTYAHTRLHAYCSDYVPMDSGMLNQTVEITPEYVNYKQPYAHFQWEGKVFVDEHGSTYAARNASKHATNEDLHYGKDKHNLATSHWERAAMAVKGDSLARDIELYLRSGRHG